MSTLAAKDMNTAQLRTAAGAAEDRLEWSTAAWMYDMAADKYPQPYPKAGALQVADVTALRQRAKNCRSMVAA